jgi:hypothetical protein
VSFAAITLFVASQPVFIVVSVYLVIDSVRKRLDTPSYKSVLGKINYDYSHVLLCVRFVKYPQYRKTF